MAETNPVDINRIAAAVARELTPKNGPAPLIRIGDEALALSGSVEIAIIYDSVTYSLVVQMPSASNNEEYVFSLTMQKDGGQPQTLGGFKIKDKDNWEVKVGLPQIAIGPVTLKTLAVALQQGTV